MKPHGLVVGDRVRVLPHDHLRRRYNRHIRLSAGVAVVEEVDPDVKDGVIIRCAGGGLGMCDTIVLEKVRAQPPKCQPWFQTFTGIKFDPRKATAKDIFIEDIGHALSQYCRFGGHTRHFYSVAQHVCLCHDYMPAQPVLRLQALLHDASEAYLGDVVKPLKIVLHDYLKIEKRLERIIMKRFGLPYPILPQVKHVDLDALATERRDLVRPGHVWPHIVGIEPWPETIMPWAPAVAKEQFLSRFYALAKQP